MNHRITVPAALALGTLLACPWPAAWAQTPPAPSPGSPGVQSQIDRMNAQIDALQAEVRRLQSGLAPAGPGLPKIAPVPPVSGLFVYPTIPDLKLLPLPDLKSLPGQGLGNGAYFPPRHPRRYTNIPDSRIILLDRAASPLAP